AGILPIPRRCCNGTAEEHDSIPTARTALGIAQRWAGNGGPRIYRVINQMNATRRRLGYPLALRGSAPIHDLVQRSSGGRRRAAAD
ncbi:MAG: hypothetical protein V2A73_04855, partial [Pseudomonadota bacterium]